METHKLSRRDFLSRTAATWLGAALAALGTFSCQRRSASEVSKKPGGPSLQEIRPEIALSLTLLQEKIQKGRTPLPDELAYLGINRIFSFTTESDGELLLLGSRDAALPSISVDDLAVGLRNAYQVSPEYHGAPGCTIDPWSGSDHDPWRIQQVKVFGMPSVTMAARHVSLDLELKKVSAGILSFGNGIPSLWDLNRSSTGLCTGSLEKEQFLETAHRFWFYPLYLLPPRFLEESGMVVILKPIEVQLLTEQEFFDKKGRRRGSEQASPTAKSFAETITQLLASHPHYRQLRADFQVIEFGRLFRFKNVPAENLRCLLYDYRLREAEIPSFVGGIRREERGEVVCDTQITERQVQETKVVAGRERIRRYQFRSRGGVEAKVNMSSDQFVPGDSGMLAELRRRVLSSRPSANAFRWTINY
ncbi:MAG: hypothetical protein HY695_13840 [Deltaproteobacteria bacterium]|nr:hypothetical protein [Deltaproteobacteria bacterium]